MTDSPASKIASRPVRRRSGPDQGHNATELTGVSQTARELAKWFH
jgi:hypothetical protein